MATEADKVNNGALATVIVVGAFAMLGISLALVALVREELDGAHAAKEGYASVPRDEVQRAQRERLQSGLPIEAAMKMVVQDVSRDPNSATAPLTGAASAAPPSGPPGVGAPSSSPPVPGPAQSAGVPPKTPGAVPDTAVPNTVNDPATPQGPVNKAVTNGQPEQKGVTLRPGPANGSVSAPSAEAAPAKPPPAPAGTANGQ